ncbi:sensor histidine kinase [Phytoactinopolyspora halotolerans]|uniref:histidine kinase n=1 Tax=Phytoactinopolyspora halotolerans TaxID=1981512 RepID=A0A6L9S3H1_9ACTN|nr:histidine kinase [Phytoactinopolyspora halotolerans]NED99380.1 sensor histidine kinase [Phytoactinopolyspora halotolerans]
MSGFLRRILSAETEIDLSVSRWRRQRRHRVVDWIVAVVCFPFVFVFVVTPGGLALVDDGDMSRSDTPSLAFRLLPGLLPDNSELAGLDSMVEAVFHNIAFGLAATIVLPGLAAWAILYRRTKPERLLTLAVMMLLLFGDLAPIVVALYSYAAWFTNRRRLVGWAAAAAVALVIGLWNTPQTWSELFLGVLFVGVVVGMPMSLGLWISTRWLLVASLRERAERLEREQQLMAERAVAAERTRIAREMHDVVAHRVSLMVLHAGGLEVAKTDPGVVETAAQIRDTGREALTELREVLGVLRDDSEAEAPTAPLPVLADLDRLVEGWRSAGMILQYGRTGSVRPFPALVERTGYRVVQEALTNAAKHAPGAFVRVQLDYRLEELIVTVTNGRSVTTFGHGGGCSSVSGYGLAGLRERVLLAHGKLDTDVLSDGSWQVRATLPENVEDQHERTHGADSGVRPDDESAGGTDGSGDEHVGDRKTETNP